jgi:hypothetical protein
LWALLGGMATWLMGFVQTAEQILVVKPMLDKSNSNILNLYARDTQIEIRLGHHLLS